MNIPTFLYGPYSEVKKRCAQKATELRNGAPFERLTSDFLDTSNVSGTLVLEGPVQRFSSGANFCCFALTVAISDEIIQGHMSQEFWEKLHDAGLRYPWVFLGLLGQHSAAFLHRSPSWHLPFLRAAVEFWPVLAAEGARYSFGREPTDLWSLPTNIRFVLARLGLPIDRLKDPLPQGELSILAGEILERVPS
jgi:hypothetical protein